MKDIPLKENNIINILIVDDSSACRNMTRKSLLLSGYEYDLEVLCDEAPDGKSAVDIVYHNMNDYKNHIESSSKKTNCNELYDLILMDYQMPIMDGPTAIREIRALGYKGIIVGLTGNVLSDDIDVLRNAGADEVLTKPVKNEMLESMLLHVYNEKVKYAN